MLDLFEDDADFVIGNFPVAIGHVNIAASAQSVYNLCKSLKHTTTKLHDIKDGQLLVSLSSAEFL